MRTPSSESVHTWTRTIAVASNSWLRTRSRVNSSHSVPYRSMSADQRHSTAERLRKATKMRTGGHTVRQVLEAAAATTGRQLPTTLLGRALPRGPSTTVPVVKPARVIDRLYTTGMAMLMARNRVM